MGSHMKRWFSLLLLVACGASAAEACQPVRVGYSDRERVPYYMGNGSEVPASRACWWN
jgi:ABC-type oligopeptide transport system substrate-binding subunit